MQTAFSRGVKDRKDRELRQTSPGNLRIDLDFGFRLQTCVYFILSV